SPPLLRNGGRTTRNLEAGTLPVNAEVDALVVGAGPAGSATAIALSRRNLSVLLVERAPAREASDRVHRGSTPALGESLPGVSKVVLRELGLWERFHAGVHRRTYLTKSAWGTSEPRERHAISGRYGPAYHVHRPSFDAFLAGEAEMAGAEVWRGCRVESVQFSDASR